MPDDTSPPVGMVDSLLGQGGGPTEESLAFAQAYMVEGEMDPAVVAAIVDPENAARRVEAAVALRARDWPALSHYRDANAALKGQPVEAVFLGDSITQMWGIAQPELFTGGIVNRGISGQTSPQMLLRFMADVVALKPKFVHIMCGINDVAGNTGPTTPQDYQNNILAMLALARTHGIDVILASLTPIRGFSWSPEISDPQVRVAELNRWLRDMATERGLIHADYASVLADAGGLLRMDYARDGVHPHAAGYQAMQPVAERALAAVRARWGEPTP